MAQYAVPISDAIMGWIGNPAPTNTGWDKVDEGIISGTPDDGATSVYTPTVGSTYVGNCGSVADPKVDTGHKVRIRARSRVLTTTPTLQILFGTASQGVLHTQNVSYPFDGLWVTNVINIPTAKAALISDYPNIQIGMTWTVGGSVIMQCTALEFECPDAPTGLKGWWRPQWRF